MPTQTPDLTLAQVYAVVGWIAAQAVAWAWLSSLPSQVILSATATLIFTAWKFADAHIRGRRALVAAAAYTAAYAAAPGGAGESTEPAGPPKPKVPLGTRVAPREP